MKGFYRVETNGNGEGGEVFRVREGAISPKTKKKTSQDRPIKFLNGLAQEKTTILWSVDIDRVDADPDLSKAVDVLLLDGHTKGSTACSLGLYSCFFLEQVLEDAAFLIV